MCADVRMFLLGFGKRVLGVGGGDEGYDFEMFGFWSSVVVDMFGGKLRTF